MNKKLILGLAIGLFSSQIFAVSFGSFDPRSLAMGSVGVASGDASNASYYNPALLSLAQESDDFSLVIPTIGIGLADPDDLTGALDTYGNGNYETNLDSAISSYNGSSSALNNRNDFLNYINAAAAVSTASTNLVNGITSLSNKSLIINSNAGLLMAVPSTFVGFSASYNARIIGGGRLNIDSTDTNLVQGYITVMTCLGNIDQSLSDILLAAAFVNCGTGANDPNNLINDTTGQFTDTNGTVNNLASRIEARGATVTETSFSFAHLFPSLGGISLGVTPKSVEVETFDYAIALDNADISTDTGTLKHSDTNIDIGAAMKLTDSIKVGLVAKNLIGKNYDTARTPVTGKTVNVETQLRAGIAYQNDWVLAAFDLDLTENKGLGFEADSQYAALGFEFDAFDVLKLRAGYRQNLKAASGSEASITSFGIGLNIVAVHFDLGIAQNNDEVLGGFQLGIEF